MIEHFGIFPEPVVDTWPKGAGMQTRGEPESHDLEELGDGLIQYFTRERAGVEIDGGYASVRIDPGDAEPGPANSRPVMTLAELWATLLYSNYDLEAGDLRADSNARVVASMQDPAPRLDNLGVARVRKALSFLPGRAALAFERGLMWASRWLSESSQGATLSSLERLGVLARGEIYLGRFLDGTVHLPDPSLSQSGVALLAMSPDLVAGVDALADNFTLSSWGSESYGNSLPCVDPLASSLEFPYPDGRRLVSARIVRGGIEQFVVLRAKSRAEAAMRVALHLDKEGAQSAVWVLQENPWLAYASGALLHLVSPSVDETSLQATLWPGYEGKSPIYGLAG